MLVLRFSSFVESVVMSLSASSSPQSFPPTQWSLILSAGDEDSAIRSRALERICQTYWQPVYAYTRKRGFDPADAEDVTQEFFAYLLKTEAFEKLRQHRGKLRNFLLVAVRNFMANEWAKRKRQKRGGGATILHFDVEEAENQTCLDEAMEHLTPEAVFERHWATALLHTVMERLERVYEESDRAAVFNELKEFMARGRGERSYREAGEAIGMSEAAVKIAVHRMRKRYRELLLEEIEGTLQPGESAEEELRYLFGVFQA